MAYGTLSPERLHNVDVFNDTLAFIKENASLADAVEKSIAESKCYPEDASFNLTGLAEKAGVVIVCESDSFTYAVKMHSEHPDAKIAVLNFANSKYPGGGVKKGSRAQEESLCRTSTLYPVISADKFSASYYGPNGKRRGDDKALQSDNLIYSPGIIICKTTDKDPKRVDESQFTAVDVITCAAPNLGASKRGPAVSIDDESLYRLHVGRASHIVGAAAENGADILILGAFGCGAFKNDPEVVARAYKEVLSTYARHFQAVIFPIPAGENLETFRRVLS